MIDQTRCTVVWRTLDGRGIEYCSLVPGQNRWLLRGTAIRAEPQPLLVRYAVTCDAHWRTRTVTVEVESGTDRRTVRVRVDKERHWWIGDTELVAIRGCIDVDLGITPATNTLPIRRLNLAIGETQAVRAAWLQFPTLAIEPLPQHYTRLDALRYRYESAEGAFTTEIAVDERGLATHYAGGWERIAATDNESGE
jgi:hypothetical protein